VPGRRRRVLVSKCASVRGRTPGPPSRGPKISAPSRCAASGHDLSPGFRVSRGKLACARPGGEEAPVFAAQRGRLALLGPLGPARAAWPRAECRPAAPRSSSYRSDAVAGVGRHGKLRLRSALVTCSEVKSRRPRPVAVSPICMTGYQRLPICAPAPPNCGRYRSVSSARRARSVWTGCRSAIAAPPRKSYANTPALHRPPVPSRTRAARAPRRPERHAPAHSPGRAQHGCRRAHQ
jgi:hypothetical protein